MATFLVTYDLKAPGRDYEPVWAYLKLSGTHWHALGSVWLIGSNDNAGKIRDDLRALVDSNDRIMVVRVDGRNWATTGLGDGSEWMRKNVAE